MLIWCFRHCCWCCRCTIHQMKMIRSDCKQERGERSMPSKIDHVNHFQSNLQRRRAHLTGTIFIPISKHPLFISLFQTTVPPLSMFYSQFSQWIFNEVWSIDQERFDFIISIAFLFWYLIRAQLRVWWVCEPNSTVWSLKRTRDDVVVDCVTSSITS